MLRSFLLYQRKFLWKICYSLGALFDGYSPPPNDEREEIAANVDRGVTSICLLYMGCTKPIMTSVHL